MQKYILSWENMPTFPQLLSFRDAFFTSFQPLPLFFCHIMIMILRIVVLLQAETSNKHRYMSTIEMKYSLFKDIDSITDEMMLHKLVALVKGMLAVPHMEAATMDEANALAQKVINIVKK